MSLRLIDIESRICEEGKYLGFPTTYVTLQDEKEKKYTRKSIERVVRDVRKFRNNHVYIVGKEPLLQDDTLPLVYELTELGFKVCVFTKGDNLLIDDRTFRNFSYSMVVNPTLFPSCEFKGENLRKLIAKDEVIFITTDEAEYEYFKGLLKKYPTNAVITFYAQTEALEKELSTWVHDDKLKNTKVGFQVADRGN